MNRRIGQIWVFNDSIDGGSVALIVNCAAHNDQEIIWCMQELLPTAPAPDSWTITETTFLSWEKYPRAIKWKRLV